jgi:hypothetical protein
MDRIRLGKNTDSTIISNVFLNDKRITLKSKGLLAMVMSLPNDFDFSVKHFQESTKESKDAIYSAIKELENLGYCQKNRIIDSNGCFCGWNYIFYEKPL